MDIRIRESSYNDLNPQYLHTVHSEQSPDNNLISDKQDIAAIYTPSEPDAYAVYNFQDVKSAEINPKLIGKMKVYLKDMGFYNGEMGGTVTEELKKSLISFQRAYLSPTNFDNLKNGISVFLIGKVDEVGAAYYTNYSDGRATAALKALGVTDPSAEIKKNFARIWTFLDKGIRCTTDQIAGILGNVMQECRFNELSENKTTGAFGIFQWKADRRSYLEHFASEYGGDSKSIGTQLAYFRYEVSVTWGKDHLGRYAQNSHLVDGWKEFMRDGKNDYNKASDIFYKKIEEPNDGTDLIRRVYAKAIYNAIKR